MGISERNPPIFPFVDVYVLHPARTYAFLLTADSDCLGTPCKFSRFLLLIFCLELISVKILPDYDFPAFGFTRFLLSFLILVVYG
jgi:hypothetical protein